MTICRVPKISTTDEKSRSYLSPFPSYHSLMKRDTYDSSYRVLWTCDRSNAVSNRRHPKCRVTYLTLIESCTKVLFLDRCLINFLGALRVSIPHSSDSNWNELKFTAKLTALFSALIALYASVVWGVSLARNELRAIRSFCATRHSTTTSDVLENWLARYCRSATSGTARKNLHKVCNKTNFTKQKFTSKNATKMRWVQ